MVGIRARQKAERPGAILEAALEEFITNGYEATRLEDVAARVGVTKGTIYLYFGSKEIVFAAAVQSVAGAPFAVFNIEPFVYTENVVDDLVTYLRGMYQFIVSNPRMRETLRLLLAEAKRFPDLVDQFVQQFTDPILLRLAARLEAAASAGQIRADMPNLADIIAAPPLAHMVIMLLFGDRRPSDIEALLETQARLMTSGLLASNPVQSDV